MTADAGYRRTQRRPGRSRQTPHSAGASFWILVALIALCALGGGSSRVDVQSLLFVRPAAVLAMAALVALPGPWDVQPIRVPAMCLAALAALMLAQLIPLPPALWTMLPGHGRFVAAAGLIGIPQPWQPMSVTPDLGWSSFFDLLVPAAVLTGYARLTGEDRLRLLNVVVALITFSALLAVLQIGAGTGYLYRLTSYDLPVGPFANRNHQAALLAIALPALRVWAGKFDTHARASQIRFATALALAVVIVLLIMLTGSRAGLALTAAMLLIAGTIAGSPFRPRHSRSRYGALWMMGGIGVLLVAVGGLAIAMGRSVTMTRLLEADVLADQRSRAAPVVWRIVRDFLPWGSGFGSFDRAFRIYEPDTLLHGNYFNHAHNDLVELLLTGGLPVAVILAVFLAWWGRQTVAAIRVRHAEGATKQALLLARAGAAITLGIGLASLVDYPLRTQLMAAVFTLGVAWLCTTPKQRTVAPRRSWPG